MNIITNNQNQIDKAIIALKEVLDPEIGLNIVDLGLVYEINFFEDKKRLECIMTLTTQFCPMGETITENTKSALEKLFLGYEILVTLTFDPAWNYSLISEEGRAFLGK